MDKAFDVLSRVALRSGVAGAVSLTAARYLGCTFRIINKPAISSDMAFAALGAGVTFAGSALSCLFQIKKTEGFAKVFLGNSFASGAIFASLTLLKRYVDLTRRDAAILTLVSSLCHLVFLKLEFSLRKLEKIKDDKIKANEATIEANEAKIKANEATIEANEAKIKANEAKIKGNELAIQTLKGQNTQNQTQIQEKEAKISEKDVEILELKQKLAEANSAKKDDLSEKLQKELQEAKKAKEELEAQLMSLQKEKRDTASLNTRVLENLNNDIEKLKKEASIFDSEKKELKEDNTKVKTALEEKDKLLDQDRELREQLKAGKEALEKQIKEKEQEIEALQKDKGALEEKNGVLSSEIQEFTLKIRGLNEKIKELNQATESSEDLHSKEKAEYVQEIQELKAKLNKDQIPRITQEQILEVEKLQNKIDAFKKDGFKFEGENPHKLEQAEQHISNLQNNIEADQNYDKKYKNLLSDLNESVSYFNKILPEVKTNVGALEQAKIDSQTPLPFSEAIKNEDIFVSSHPGTPEPKSQKGDNLETKKNKKNVRNKITKDS